ncbi:MAG: hypothetical protein BRD23_07180 [Halobacteriales archaeon SW_9_67_25]|jgi:hypothetical protein|nr:MAG: hypothetical protein BRD23_07180 [Halobacteriales archaeon SW_9_67_25]
MHPARVDSLVDLAYGVLILAAIVLMVVVTTRVGIAFGIGVFLAYATHVVWKMARYDPEWMTREVAQQVEDELSEEVTAAVSEEMTETVEEAVSKEVTGAVEDTVEETVEKAVKDATDAES